MRYGHSVAAVRAAEGALMALVPEGALMQRAAAGLAAVCADLLGRVYGSRVVVLTGSGSNGGDALYAGARLARRGAGVTAVLLAPDRTHAEGLAALLAAGGRTVTEEDGPRVIAGADLVLDGITGIGGKGGLRPAAVPQAEAARQSRAAVVAVDLPSGVDADTGELDGPAVHADVTVTFGTYKTGLLIDPAAELAGVLRLVDIGLDAHLGAPEVEALQHADLAALLPRPGGESDKYRRGVVGVAAGSQRYPGAAVLAVSGALRAGAGAVRYVGPGGDAVLARHPEVLVSAGSPHDAGRVQAWVVGPGLGDTPDAHTAVHEVLAAGVPVLVDADGLRLIDPETVRARTAPTVLTPHAGEAAALLGWPREDVEARRLEAVRALAGRFGATVLLKGATTLVADPDPAVPVRVNPTGTAWLATAGSGDVLSGLTGSLLAAGLAPRDAASAGAYLHGLAGRLAEGPLSALDVADTVPAAWRNVQD
ncbi:NAD(P)H-hydrate dehydratase [Streptomyces sp. NBC_01476]|uniref:NAD(P)H-hydrate dehydratase n=1 Tax=Streptomyces sp. NBC_01476 TaxID=2903881 RepID=UPI002E32B3B3|nr:NAD(P)H-hydrate dehydratase [Streptomyces sp. NBC_01476]